MTSKRTEAQPAAPSFQVELSGLRLAGILCDAAGATAGDAHHALAEAPLSLEGAARLLRSPVEPILDDLVEHARTVTLAKHGRSIALNAPCFVSSFCVNQCAYCDKQTGTDAPRVWLSPTRVRVEVARLARHGIRRVLLVAGESPTIVPPESIAETIAAARSVVPEVDVLAAPVEEADYRTWVKAGAQGVVGYQETYDPAVYAFVHPRGPKTLYHHRLGALERAGAAGMERLGLGVLLGLAEPALDLLTLIAHARFLSRRFPDARLTLGIPRAVGRETFQPPHRVEDLELLRDFAVLRLALPDAGLAVTTREPEWLRGRLLACATEMSVRPPMVQDAHIECAHDGGAFEIMDWRSAEEMQWEVEDLGYSVRRMDTHIE